MNRSMPFSRRHFLGKITLTSLGMAAVGMPDMKSRAEVLNDFLDKKQVPWVLKSDRKIRIGVVGGGFGAEFYWHQHPNCTVEAVSDLQEDRKIRLMQVYGCNKSYESLEKLVLDENIEAVAVFTDAPSHGRHIVEVLKHGKHCLCAVPLSMTLEDLALVKEWKKKTGLQVMMAETSVFHSDLYNAKLIYEKGLFGKIVYSEGEYYHANVDTAWGYKEWRNALPPMLYPTHATAYYIGVTGKRYTSVSCLGFRGDAPRYADNAYGNPFSSESALFETSEGGMSRINIFWGAEGAEGETGRLFGQYGRFDGDRLQVGESMPTKIEAVGEGNQVVYPDNRPVLPPNMERGGHGGSHGYLSNEFIMALVEEREPLIDIYESMAMTAPGIIAHQSALRNGERMAIPNFDN